MSSLPMKKAFDLIETGRRVYLMTPGHGVKVYGRVIAFVQPGHSLRKALIGSADIKVDISVKDVSDRFPRYVVRTEENPPRLRIPNAGAVYLAREQP